MHLIMKQALNWSSLLKPEIIKILTIPISKVKEHSHNMSSKYSQTSDSAWQCIEAYIQIIWITNTSLSVC